MPVIYCAALLAANTSLRPVEVKNLRRGNVDLFQKTITVTRSKNEAGKRTIPLNDTAIRALAPMLQRADALGHSDASHFTWCASQWGKFDPAKPTKKWDTAWRSLRRAANLPCLRFHDLRHTFITELGERGVPDRVMESIVGPLSPRMLDHYSHVRMDAKRKALDDLDAGRRGSEESALTPMLPARRRFNERGHNLGHNLSYARRRIPLNY